MCLKGPPETLLSEKGLCEAFRTAGECAESAFTRRYCSAACGTRVVSKESVQESAVLGEGGGIAVQSGLRREACDFQESREPRRVGLHWP